MPNRLSNDAVRQLLRLCGECTELTLAGEEPSVHFMNGLARLTQSQVVLWISASGVELEGRPVFHEVRDVGWSTDSDRARVYEYVETNPLKGDPLCASLLAERAPIVTRARAEAVGSPDWANSEILNDVHLPSGIDDSLLSLARKPGSRASVLGFKRPRGERPYDAEDSDFVHLVHSECSWVFEPRRAVKTTRPADDWSPREGAVLDLLLTGASEKVGAARLGLSPHTFHGYVKAIYRKLKIGSRAELMALALERGR